MTMGTGFWWDIDTTRGELNEDGLVEGEDMEDKWVREVDKVGEVRDKEE